MIPKERLVAMFAALDAEGRRYAELILQHEYDRVARERQPTLRAVGGSQVQGRAKPAPSRTLAPDEAALLETCGDMDENGRDRLVSIARHLQKRFPRQRPTLVLVNIQRGAR